MHVLVTIDTDFIDARFKYEIYTLIFCTCFLDIINKIKILTRTYFCTNIEKNKELIIL